MSTELVNIDKQKIQALRALAGEVERSSVNIPQITIDSRIKVDKKANPNYGGFCTTEKVKNSDGSFTKNYTELGKTIQAVILRRRDIADKWDEKLEKYTYYTREFDSYSQPIELFSDKKSVGVDFYKNWKEKYKIRPSMILYLYFQENIYRLKVSSSSMFTYSDYLEQFRDSHVSLVETEIGTQEDQKNESSAIYFKATFRQAAPFDYDKSYKLISELNDALKLYEQSRKINKEPQPLDTSDYQDKEEVIDTTNLPF